MANECRVILGSAYKVGSTWALLLLQKMGFRFVDDIPESLRRNQSNGKIIDLQSEGARDFVENLPVLSLVKSHSLPPPWAGDPPEDVKFVSLVRDPRDAVISLAHYVVTLPPELGGNEVYAQLPLEERVLRILGGEKALTTRYEPLPDLLEQWRAVPNSIQLRYEDLLADTVGQLEVLNKELDLSLSAERLREVAKACDFRTLSQGRDRGEEDVKSLFRKGVAGDWRNVYTPEIVHAFKVLQHGRWQDLLVDLGYEEDDQWDMEVEKTASATTSAETMITYAQNFEDVLLNRVFGGKAKGFYIDVGAHDPEYMSVTKHFYDLGWSGINVEPLPGVFERLQAERPRDINLNLAMGSRYDTLKLHVVAGENPWLAQPTTLSSLDATIAKDGAKALETAHVEEVEVEVRTLSEICSIYCRKPIDFLKIDVEGWERQVIEGADFEHFRPVVLVVEATKPHVQLTDFAHPESVDAWSDWEPMVLDAGYVFAYFDGLSRYYVRKEDAHLTDVFSVPTGIHDNFVFADLNRIAPRALEEIAADGQKLEAVTKTLHEVEADLRGHKAFVSDLQEQLRAAESTKLDDIRAAVAIEKEELTKAHAAEMEALKRKNGLLEEGLSRVKAESESEALEHESARNVLLREKLQLADQLAKTAEVVECASAELASLRPENEWLRSETDRLEVACAAQRERAEALRDRLRAAGERGVQLEREMARLTSEVNSLESWGDGLKRELERVGRLLRDATERGDKARDEAEVLKNENKLLSSERTELRQALTVIRQVVRESEYRKKHRLWLSAVTKVPQLARLKRHVELPALGSGALPEPGQTPLPTLGAPTASPEIHVPDKPASGVSTLISQRSGRKTGQRFTLSASSENVLRANPGYWAPVIDALSSVKSGGESVVLDLMPELTQAHEVAIDGPWVGRPCTPPNVPEFWRDVASQSWVCNRDWQHSSAWESCRAVIATSGYAADYARSWTTRDVATIRLPIPQDRPLWDQTRFTGQIIQPAEPQMRFHGLHMLGLNEARTRIAWHTSESAPPDLIEAEQEYLMSRNLLFPFMAEGVTADSPPAGEHREECFACSVFFMHLHDSFCPVSLLECIASATPVVVNAIPAVRELLGVDYPLYFFSYPDAAAKIQNEQLLAKAHEYLTKLPCRTALTMDAFTSDMEAL